MKRKGHDQRAYLFDMLDNAKIVGDYIKGIDFDEFWDDHARRDAVALRLAMIGEAATGVGNSTERLLPAIPFWRHPGFAKPDCPRLWRDQLPCRMEDRDGEHSTTDTRAGAISGGAIAEVGDRMRVRSGNRQRASANSC